MNSIKEIAKITNTTPEKVSGVFNYNPNVNLDYDTKIQIFSLALESELDALKDSKKKYKLKKGLTFGIAVAMNPKQLLGNPYYLYLYLSIEKLCEIDGIKTIKFTNKVADFEINEQKDIDGLLAIGIFSTHQLKNLLPLSKNIVFIDSNPYQGKYDSILVNTSLGTLQALEHLYKLGHKRIAFLGGPAQDDQRKMTYKNFMKRHNIYNPSYFYEGKSETAEEGKRLITQTLIDNKEFPTAFFVCNDTFATSVLSRLKDYKYKVPEKISLIGFNNFPLSKLLKPPLTTVNVPMNFISSNSIDILVERIKTKDKNPKTIYVPTKLIVRESTKAYKHR